MSIRTKYAIVACLAFIAGAASEYWFLTEIWPRRHLSYTWIYTLRNHRKPGEPCKTDLVLDRQGYSAGYSFQQKSALWVSYILSAGSVSINVERSDSFYADPDIPEKYRVQPEDHIDTGYDKGHLAPSGSIDFSEKANHETFALSNVALQHAKLNRQAWNRLENHIRDWTKTKGKLYVVTGPLYSSRPKKIHGIPVPSQFYKVVYAYDAQHAIGFVFPNKAVANNAVWKYAFPVREIEQKTGLNFFSNFREKTQNQIEETADIAWWQQH